jgi:hypothetical protein
VTQSSHHDYEWKGTRRISSIQTWPELLPGGNDLARLRTYREIGWCVGTRPDDAAVSKLAIRHRIRQMAAAVVVLMLALPAQSSAQTPTHEGNESDFKDWQPTRGKVSTEERAAGVRQSPTQRNAEDRELKQIDQNLMRNEQPSSPTGKPDAPP